MVYAGSYFSCCKGPVTTALMPVLRHVARKQIRDEPAWVPDPGSPRVRVLHSISQTDVLVAETRLSHLAPVR